MSVIHYGQLLQVPLTVVVIEPPFGVLTVVVTPAMFKTMESPLPKFLPKSIVRC